MGLFRLAEEGVTALKVNPGDYVLLNLPTKYADDRSNIDRLSAQVRRSWPGLHVLVVVGDLGVAVLSKEDLPFDVAGLEHDDEG